MTALPDLQPLRDALERLTAAADISSAELHQWGWRRWVPGHEWRYAKASAVTNAHLVEVATLLGAAYNDYAATYSYDPSPTTGEFRTTDPTYRLGSRIRDHAWNRDEYHGVPTTVEEWVTRRNTAMAETCYLSPCFDPHDVLIATIGHPEFSPEARARVALGAAATDEGFSSALSRRR